MISTTETVRLINDDRWGNIENLYDGQCGNLIGTTVFGVVCLLLGAAFVFLGIFLNYSVTWYWAWLGSAIGLFTIGFIVLLVVPLVWCSVRDNSDLFNHWKEQPQIIFWQKQDFPLDIWTKYIDDEYGYQGRSVIKYDLTTIITYVIGWILLCGFCCGMIAIRLVLRDGLAPVGELSFGAFIAVMGISLGTFITLLYLIGNELAICWRRSAARGGPSDFVANENAYMWNNSFFITGPAQGCATRYVLEDKRVNLYHGHRHPCVEIGLSIVTRNGKKYFFHRIPIPPNKMVEAEQFAQPYGVHKHPCWSHITGYAKDLDNQIIS